MPSHHKHATTPRTTDVVTDREALAAGTPGPRDTARAANPARDHAPSIFVAGELVNDRIRIVRLLAIGGMGEVYEAIDETLEKRIALKTPHARIARDAASRGRFKREILLAHRVTHPNVCRTFDAGWVDDIPFLTMELLRGETLAERLVRTRCVPAAEALPIIAQLAAGLSAAHDAHIVHGDFKSSNVMLVATAEGGVRAVVLDFGIAGAVADARRPAAAPSAGSPAYMAPERLQGHAASAAGDVYALGVVIHEMVTGALPFAGQPALARLDQPAPPPSRRAPGLPPHWDAVVLRCLARDPAQRFGDPREVARALAEPPAHRAPRRAPAIAGLAIAATIAGAVVWRAWPAPAGRPALPRDPAVAELYRAGVAQLDQRECARAAQPLAEVTRRDAAFGNAYTRLAEAYGCVGKTDAAVTAATSALGLSAWMTEDDRTRAEAAYWTASGAPDRAVPLYARLFVRHPDDLGDGQRVLEAQLSAGATAAAHITLALVARTGGAADPQTLVLEAMLLLTELADPREAILKAEEAIARGRALHRRVPVALALSAEVEALYRLGQIEHGLEVAASAQARWGEIGDDGNLSNVALAQSDLLRRAGALARSEQRAAAAVQYAEASGSPARLRDARLSAAKTALARSDFAAARAALLLVAHTDQLARQPRDQAHMICTLGVVQLMQGQVDRAMARRAEALAAVPDLAGDAWLARLDARIAFARDDRARARIAFEAELSIRSQYHDWPIVADSRQWLADIAMADDDPSAAEGHAQAALDVLEHSGQADEAAIARTTLALVALAGGRLALAATRLAPAVIQARTTERPRVRVLVALAQAQIDATSGEPARVAAARRAMAQVVADAERADLAEALDARLVLGELALRDGARGPLAQLARDAEARGMLRIAHRARRALGG